MRIDPITGRLFHLETSIGAEGDPGGGEPPDLSWAPEQFRNLPPDQIGPAIAKSYAELRSETDRLRSQAEQDRAEFREALTQIQAAREEPAPVYDPNADPLLTAYQRAFDEGDSVGMLSVQLQLQQAAIRAELEGAIAPLRQGGEQAAAAQRDIYIDRAEERVAEEARRAGLDYEASRDDVIKAIDLLGGLPSTGDLETYTESIRRAVRLVHADAVLEASSASGERQRAKLSDAVSVGGVPGRVAQGAPAEKQAWEEIKSSPTGGYAELRRGR